MNAINLSAAIATIKNDLEKNTLPNTDQVNAVYKELIQAQNQTTIVIIELESYNKICNQIIASLCNYPSVLPIVSAANSFNITYHKIINDYKKERTDQINKELEEYRTNELAKIHAEINTMRNRQIYEINNQIQEYRKFASNEANNSKPKDFGFQPYPCTTGMPAAANGSKSLLSPNYYGNTSYITPGNQTNSANIFVPTKPVNNSSGTTNQPRLFGEY